MQDVLAETGELSDTPAGWSAYRAYLHWQACDGPLVKEEASATLCRGWAIGGKDFKAALIRDHVPTATARAWDSEGAREMKEQAWEEMTVWALAQLGRREEELALAAISAPWKVAVALFLKEHSQASNPWLAGRLKFGRPKYVSRLVTAQPQRPDVFTLAALLRGKWAA